MKTIMLYGPIGAKFGRVHRYNVSSPVEAIKALSATIDGFKQSFIDGGHYKILIGGKSSVNLEESVYPVSEMETIRIIPVVAGAGGLGKAILGVALVVASGGLALGVTGAFGLSAAATAITAGVISNIGMSLVIGGVSQMLFSPQASSGPQERPENKPSFMFNGAVNTVKQGNPAAICYGTMMVGSQVISAGLSVSQI